MRLPHAFSPRHMESRDAFPIEWEADTPEHTTEVAAYLALSLVEGGLAHRFEVFIIDSIVGVTRP